MEAEARELDSRCKDVLDQEFGLGDVGPELHRQVGFGRGIGEGETDEYFGVGRTPGELLRLAGVVDHEAADAGPICVIDVAALLDRVGVDTAVHRDP